MNDDNNVFSVIRGGKDDDEQGLPANNYVITDCNGDEWFAHGFLIFTGQHVAVMKETEKGAIPALVVPLTRVAAAEIIQETDDEDELPF